MGRIAGVALHALRAHWRGQRLAVGDLLASLFVLLEWRAIDRENFKVAFLHTSLPIPAGNLLQRVRDDSLHVFPLVGGQNLVSPVPRDMTALWGFEGWRRVLPCPGGEERPPRQPVGPRQYKTTAAAAAAVAVEAALRRRAADDRRG